MTSFLDGQQNLAALSVPGVYVDIVPPQPFLSGVPTNIMGLVGVASWGPVNAPVTFSGPDSCAVIFGTAQVRKYDLATYVLAASQVGAAIGYSGVRVSDGADVAATNTVGTGGTYASGTVTFSANPANADTLTINGTVITFSSANKGATLAATLQILLAELQNSADTNLVACTYSLVGSVLTVKAAATGTGGSASSILRQRARWSAEITSAGKASSLGNRK